MNTTKRMLRGLLGWLIIGCGAYAWGNYSFANRVIAAAERMPIVKVKHHPETLDELITRMAEERSVDPNVALGIAHIESSKNPKRINHNDNGRKSYGLYQINDWWLKNLKTTPEQLVEDVELNTFAGVRHIANCAIEAAKTETTRKEYYGKLYGCYTAGEGKNVKNYKLYQWLKKNKKLS